MYHFCNKVAIGLFLTLILFLFAINVCLAQAVGDFESNGTGGGTWNVATTWLTYNGTSYVAAGAAPATSSNNIIIQAGDVVSVTNAQTLGANITVTGNLTVTATGTLACSIYNVLGTGSFTLSAAGTLGIGSPTGISTTAATGNIQVTGGKTFNAGANYTYSGAVAQVTGNALPSPTTGALSFTNTNGSGTSLSNNLTVTSPGTVTVTGALACNTFFISGTGTFTLNAGGILLTANAAGISATGASGSIQTTTISFNTAASYIYYGSVAQVTGTGLPATIASLNINNSSVGGVTLTNGITLDGVLTLTNGIFCLNGNTLTLPTGRTIARSKGSLSLCGGTISLTGTVNITYTGSTVIPTGPEIPTSATGLNNLTINNTAGIQLTTAVTVTGNLIMTQGNINLNSNALTLGTSAALPGTLNYTAGAMINTGTLIRWFAASTIAAGNVAGLFPAGNTTDDRPFSVSIPTAPTTGGTIAVSYTDAGTNTAVSFPDGASAVQVIKNLNWSVTTGNGLAGGSYNLEISGTSYGVIGNVSDLRITLVGSVVGTAGVNAGTISNPQVNRTGLTSANLTNVFYLGSVNSSSSPLPITLLSFIAAVQQSEVNLNWSTAAEINNAFFTIQRSKDAVHWENIGEVAGAGNSSITSSYTFADRAPYPGTSYYRLIQTDLDGQQTYSFVLSVWVAAPTTASVYPNPASNLITIILPGTGSYDLSLFNTVGQQVIGPIAGSGHLLVLPVSTLSDGVYIIRISQASVTQVIKVVIKK
jgi:hypothetical protein